MSSAYEVSIITLVSGSQGTVVKDPTLVQRLFNDTRLAWVWLIVRLYLASVWLESGLRKLADPAWMDGGQALKAFWERAVQVPAPPARPPIAFDWYRAFIQGLLDGGHYTWFAKLVVFGEIAIAIALIVGAFVGVAAFFAGFMNWNFIMAGTASTNGLLLVWPSC